MHRSVLAGLAAVAAALTIAQGAAAAPEDILRSDRGLQVIGLVWLAVFTAGVVGV